VQTADPFEAQQESLELVFPSEQPPDGSEPLLEEDRIVDRLASTLWRLSSPGIGSDVGYHTEIENGLSIPRTVVDAIQADDGALQGKADGLGDA